MDPVVLDIRSRRHHRRRPRPAHPAHPDRGARRSRHRRSTGPRGLATVTALIGEGGLGSLIYDGLLRDFKTPLVVGTVLCVALAVMSDLGLAGLQRVVTPWARSRAVP